MITFEITPEIEKQINREIAECVKRIEKEMTYTWDLRNYDEISRYSKHVAYLKEALYKGEI